jgi:Type I phosphodiesterase / nucleotide pyrophosphatase
VRVILVEFNELSPQLMRKFIAAGKLPNFQRFHDQSTVYETAADDDENLEPWIQWIAVHSGVPFSRHGIKHLGEGTKLQEDNLWDVLSDAGKKVWVCGSMNINYRPPINGWVLPDPWNAKAKPYPEDALGSYYRFVAANVQEHTREDSPLSRSEQLEFLRFMARHGLSPGTVGAIVKQLAAERRSDVGWKRAVLLDRLQYDLFRWYWKKERPDFSTFFLNSTAHYQHLYWRNMEPEHFKIRPEPGEQAVYEDAILFGYEQMDRIAGKLMDLAGDDVTLVFLTALSQQPCLTYEEIGGKVIYRPTDFDEFVRSIALEGPVEVTPIMAEDFLLEFETAAAAEAAESLLRSITLDGKPAFGAERTEREIKCGCRIWERVEPDAVLEVGSGGRTIPFFDLLYQIDLIKSGEHNPTGMMWVRTPERRHEVIEEQIPLESVAPTILDMYGLRVPAHMSAEPIAA